MLQDELSSWLDCSNLPQTGRDSQQEKKRNDIISELKLSLTDVQSDFDE